MLVAQLARGRSLSDLLGAYSIVGDSDYELGEVLRYLLYHVAELDLYLGIVPVAATIVLVGRARSLDRPLQALLATTLAMTLWLVLVVSAFASVFAQRIQERNLFVVAPLFLVLLLAWVERGAPRPRVLALAAAAVRRRARPRSSPSSASSTPPRSRTRSCCCRGGRCRITSGSSGSRSSPSCSRSRSRRCSCFSRAATRSRCPLVVLAYYAAVFHPIWAGKHGVKQASAGAVFQGIRGVPRDWIDAALPAGRAGRRALDGACGPLHGQPERVLQPHGRRRVLPAPAHAGRSRRDAGAHRPSRRPGAPSRTGRRSRPSTSSPTARSPRTARSSRATTSWGRLSGGSAAMSSRRLRSKVSTRTTPGRGRR